MADSTLDVRLPIDGRASSASSQDLRKAIRAAVKAKLEASPRMAVLFGGRPLVVTRPTRAFIRLPAITAFDYGVKTDDIVPLYERTYQVDVWTRADFDLAEDIAHEIAAQLDHQPLPLPGREGQVAFLQLQQDRDEAPEDADLCRKVLIFRVLCYEYNGPGPA